MNEPVSRAGNLNFAMGGPDEMMEELRKGPITCGIHAENDYLRYYNSGVLTLDQTSSVGEGIQHAVVIVGRETDVNGVDHWIV